jgi:hypothetical protein
MKAQQTYAGFVARGDELFTGLRGEDEPGLATFDDEVEPVTVPTGFRDSAFDRAADAEPTSASADLIVDDEVATVPGAPAADTVATSVDVDIDELGDKIENGQQSIEELAAEAPDTEAILDEIAIDELVDQAPTLEETAPAAPAKTRAKKAAKPAKAAKPVKVTKPRKAAKSPATAPEDTTPPEDTTETVAEETALLEATLAAPGAAETVTAADTVDAEPTADVATPAEVVTPPGEATPAEAPATDEVLAAPETPAAAVTGDTSETDSAIAEGAAVDAVGETSTAPTDEPQGGSELSGSQAAGTAPIEGYDSFSIAQLRGRLRGYALSTVQDLVAYEEATRARAPYLTMLRNRLEKVEEQAVESSPFAPRGA